MGDDIAIRVQDVDKIFRLPHEKKSSVKSVFTSIGKGKKASYEIQQALQGISFEVKKGEFFGIVGRNGSGKSTLLKIIAGIYRPNNGNIQVSGRLVPFIELGVGFNPELTGRENVYLNGALMGFSSEEVDEKYNAIVDFAELERFMDQKLKNYSSGMQVRLAFSVATILAQSDILLIDEVLAVGDADFQRKCFEYFKKLKKDKKTVIFVSHDMAAVREYCDNAILIDKSEVIFKGTAQETSKEYTKLFLPHIYKAQRDEERAKKHKAAQKGSDELGKWGAGGVDISNATSKKSVYEVTDKMISISYTVSAAESFEDELIPGITIKDERGQPICGTNSTILAPQDKIRIGKNQEKLTFTWEVPNVFNQGRYTVDPAVLSGTTTDTLQWWDEAVSFRVINEFSAPYPVSPHIKLRTDA